MRLASLTTLLKQPPANSSPGVEHALSSYSQEGEDMVMRRFVDENSNGFYVDIGAHHPYRFSNTFFYYSRGWHGINVDADLDLMDSFSEARPRDINVVSAVGKKSDALTFYVFNERALNTLDKSVAQERAKIPGYKIIKKNKVPVKPLGDVLDEYLSKNQVIDFMSIDVEGKDIEVLTSNDWNKYRPRFLIVECLKTPYLDAINNDAVAKLLARHNYRPVAKTLNSVFFADCEIYETK